MYLINFTPELGIKIGVYLELLAAFVATFTFYKYKSSAVKFILPYLWYTFLNEKIARYYYDHINHTNNNIFYNIYDVITAAFIYYVYSKSIKKSTHKKGIQFLFFTYLISVIINSFYFSFINITLEIPSFFSVVLIVSCVCLYLFEILNSDKIIIINKLIMFWLSMGLLLYYLPIIPFQLVSKYYRDSSSISNIFYINVFIASLFYLILITGFICSGKNQKD